MPDYERGNKKQRIITHLEPSINSGDLRLSNEVLLKAAVRSQLRGLSYNSLPEPHDDVLDALSLAVTLLGSRLRGGRAEVLPVSVI